MADVCPHCGAPVAAPAAGSTLDRLRRWCLDNGHDVGPDDTVPEAVAAALLDRSPATLRNWRAAGTGPAYSRRGRTGRVRYRLADIVVAIEGTRLPD